MKKIVLVALTFCAIQIVVRSESEQIDPSGLTDKFDRVIICQENNMAASLLTILRDQGTSAKDFQEATNKLAPFLLFQAAEFLTFQEKIVQTPIAKHNGIAVGKPPLLVPILRSGITLLPVAQKYFKDAPVGFIGVKRDEATALPLFYYANLPTIASTDQVIILEPMLATGGSLSTALGFLKNAGAVESNIVIVCIIGAAEGVERLQREFPGVRIVLGALDAELNDAKFIVPGLGDFGDRFFGTVVDPQHEQHVVIGSLAEALA